MTAATVPGRRRGRPSKLGNTPTTYNGRRYASKFEARVAMHLDLRQRAGEFQSWEAQYQIECLPYRASLAHVDTGPLIFEAVPECTLTHRVDFRILENNGTYTLLEAKGSETPDYKMRRKWLLHFWLPLHQDHKYEVVKQRTRVRRRRIRPPARAALT